MSINPAILGIQINAFCWNRLEIVKVGPSLKYTHMYSAPQPAPVEASNKSAGEGHSRLDLGSHMGSNCRALALLFPLLRHFIRQ